MPEHVRSYFLDDMLVVVAKGGITTSERTLLDQGEDDAVREVRRILERGMSESLTEIISDLTGRHVVSYQSQIMFAPDRVIAVYIFDDTLAEHLAANP